MKLTKLLLQSAMWVGIMTGFLTLNAHFFASGNESKINLALTCFGVMCLISIMPWQLAPIHRNDQQLVQSGISMTIGSLSFLIASIIRYSATTLTITFDSVPFAVVVSIFTSILSYLSSFCFAAAYIQSVKGFLQFTDCILDFEYGVRNHANQSDKSKDTQY